MGLREEIIKELLILIGELRSKAKLAKIRNKLHNSGDCFLETWEVAELSKAIIRVFGSEQGKRLCQRSWKVARNQAICEVLRIAEIRHQIRIQKTQAGCDDRRVPALYI